MKRRKLPHVRDIYKWLTLALPVEIAMVAFNVLKMLNPCLGGCPGTWDQASASWTFPATSSDWTIGAALMVIPALWGLFAIYLPCLAAFGED